MNSQSNNMPTSARAVRWMTHGGPLRDMATSENGRLGVIVNKEGTVYVIYPSGERAPERLPIDDGICVDVSDAVFLAAIGHRRGIVSVWDVVQSRELFRCKHGTKPVMSVSFDGLSGHLASASKEGLKIWDIRDQIARVKYVADARQSSLDAYREQIPSRFVYLRGATPFQETETSTTAEGPIRWAAESIGRELARAGLGLITPVHAVENHAAAKAFLAERKRLGLDGPAGLKLLAFGADVPAPSRTALTIEIVETELQYLSGNEPAIMLGLDYSEHVARMLGLALEEIYFVPATRQAVYQSFGKSKSAELGKTWERPIKSQGYARLMAADLVHRIAELPARTPKPLENPNQQNRQPLDRASEALQRQNPEEALALLAAPALRRFDRSEVEKVFRQALHEYGRQYEHVRATQKPTRSRTQVMSKMVTHVVAVSKKVRPALPLALDLMNESDPGQRIMGLAVAQALLSPDYLDNAIYLIATAVSAFEQYHAMVLAEELLPHASLEQKVRLESSLLDPEMIPIDSSDSSRNDMRHRVLGKMAPSLASLPDYPLQPVELSSPVFFEDNPKKKHGDFVVTRGSHQIPPMPAFRWGSTPSPTACTAALYTAKNILTADSPLSSVSWTVGPRSWGKDGSYPPGTGDHPVADISYVEAQAFVTWLNEESSDADWRWVLPTEDMWELAARSPRGLLYPWGNSPERDRCNSVEANIKGPSAVSRFPGGASWCGCFDMAGNTWEFVQQTPSSKLCVLRGGSYRNNLDEVSNCFRLREVRVTLRAEDFGFRCAKVPVSFSPKKSTSQAEPVLTVKNRQVSISAPVKKKTAKKAAAKKTSKKNTRALKKAKRPRGEEEIVGRPSPHHPAFNIIEVTRSSCEQITATLHQERRRAARASSPPALVPAPGSPARHTDRCLWSILRDSWCCPRRSAGGRDARPPSLKRPAAPVRRGGSATPCTKSTRWTRPSALLELSSGTARSSPAAAPASTCSCFEGGRPRRWVATTIRPHTSRHSCH